MKINKYQMFIISLANSLSTVENSKIDTKLLIDRSGMNPKLLNTLFEVLQTSRKDDFSVIEKVEDIILSNAVNKFDDKLFNHVPTDFNPNSILFPDLKNVENINLTEMRKIFNSLNNAWLFLSKFKPKELQGTTTLIEFGIPFFAPGGRFNEFYYWDSYWILRGLLGMKMEISAMNIIKNFIFFIKTYGFIPNGSRIYYLGRTQPPFFTQMLYYLLKYNEAKFKDFVLGDALDCAITEYEWLVANRSITLERNNNFYTLCRYFEESTMPRMESFREDAQIIDELKKSKGNLTDQEINKVFTDIRSGAESGWDFSTRWFKEGSDMSTIHTSDFLAVDLNAIIYKNEKIISELLKLRGDLSRSADFEYKSQERLKAIQAVLWNAEKGIWNDFDFISGQFNDKRFYFSNIMPLCMNINPPSATSNEYAVNLMLTRYKNELFGYIGGIPCSGKSMIVSDQQWDYPNVWAPHQSMMVDYFIEKGNKSIAIHIARSFYENIKKGHDLHGVFFEKYNCNEFGVRGQGGEYLPQQGFGWTNGVAIEFINLFGKDFLNEFNHQQSFQRIEKSLESNQIRLNEIFDRGNVI